jgi:DNA-binding GntR family transcriptional regulator
MEPVLIPPTPPQSPGGVPPEPVLEARLRADIVFGVYRPEEWLKQVDVQERYGASQAEARRALATLCQAGLLSHRRHFGYRVPAFDPERSAQHRQVRKILETGCVPSLLEHVTPADIEALQALAHEFDESIESQGRMEQSRANFEFHRRLYLLTNNPVLAASIQEWRERSACVSPERWRTIAGMRHSSEEHHLIVAALARRDAAELNRLIVCHIDGSQREIPEG